MIPTILESNIGALVTVNGSSITCVIPHLSEKVCYLFGINPITEFKINVVPNSTGRLRMQYINTVPEQKCVGQDHIMTTYNLEQ